MQNCENIIEVCARQRGARFLVFDDGRLYIEPARNAPLQLFDGDAVQYLTETAGASFGDRRMVNHLMPDTLCTDFSLGFQKERGYAVFTLYSTRPPSLNDLEMAVMEQIKS